MQRYFAKAKKEDTFLLEESDYHHIKHVMRMKEQEEIEVVYDHTLFLACIENVKENPIIRIKKQRKEEGEDTYQVTLYLPLLQEQKIDYILQKATELGVFKICFIPLNRSIIKYDTKKEEKKMERWRHIVKEASEQSKRLSIPEIEIKKNIEDLRNIEGLNLVCSTKKNVENMKKEMNLHGLCDKINIVIGPEGGLTPLEEEQFVSYGFKPVSLGKRILRVETVPLYLLSIISYEWME